MTSEELRNSVETLIRESRAENREEVAELWSALLEALRRFEDRPLPEFIAKLNALKPPARRRPTATKGTSARKEKAVGSNEPKPDLQALIAELKASLGDEQRSSAAIAQANKLLKAGAVEVAKAIGMPAKTDTTKKAAVDYLKAKAAECVRDQATAERIRLGA